MTQRPVEIDGCNVLASCPTIWENTFYIILEVEDKYVVGYYAPDSSFVTYYTKDNLKEAKECLYKTQIYGYKKEHGESK